MKVLVLAIAVYRFLHHALQLLSRTTHAIASATFIYPPKLAALTSTTWCEYLCPAVRSTLWWSVAILMSHFFLTLAILEILEDGVWHHLQKLFWNIVKLSTSDAFKFLAVYILVFSYFVAPVSSVNTWLEVITKVLAPFQVAKMYIWYRDDAWDRLGDFWAVFWLSAVSTSILTSLVMTASHVSVLSFLNWWLWAIALILTAAEAVSNSLWALCCDLRSAPPRLTR